MSTVWIIVIVVAAIVLIGLALVTLGRKRRLDSRRQEAAELREQAETRARSAKQAELASEEQAERARKEREAAEEHATRAREVDPDVDDEEREQESTATR
jgi:FtsZ-interacting cell division protein ZipA